MDGVLPKGGSTFQLCDIASTEIGEFENQFLYEMAIILLT
jgi:hypothetical protein